MYVKYKLFHTISILENVRIAGDELDEIVGQDVSAAQSVREIVIAQDPIGILPGTAPLHLRPPVEEAPIELPPGTLVLPSVQLLQDLVHQYVRVVVAFQQVVEVVLLVGGFQSVEDLLRERAVGVLQPGQQQQVVELVLLRAQGVPLLRQDVLGADDEEVPHRGAVAMFGQPGLPDGVTALQVVRAAQNQDDQPVLGLALRNRSVGLASPRRQVTRAQEDEDRHEQAREDVRPGEEPPPSDRLYLGHELIESQVRHESIREAPWVKTALARSSS